MKKLASILMIIGLFILSIIVFRIYGFLIKYIFTDKQFLVYLLFGLLVTCSGFYLSSKNIQPRTEYQRRNKQSQLNNIKIVLSLCSAMLLCILIFMK